MIVGYAIIAVPTGIVSSEITKQQYLNKDFRCEKCDAQIKNRSDKYCSNCGHQLK